MNLSLPIVPASTPAESLSVRAVYAVFVVSVAVVAGVAVVVEQIVVLS